MRKISIVRRSGLRVPKPFIQDYQRLIIMKETFIVKYSAPESFYQPHIYLRSLWLSSSESRLSGAKRGAAG